MYHNFEQLQSAAVRAGSIADVVLQSEQEQHGRSREQIFDMLGERWQVMQASAEKALNTPQNMTGSLISGQAALQNKYAPKGGYTGSALNRAMALALSCSEVNAAMGRICAAPTAGACGVLPAVLITIAEAKDLSYQQILDALLVAGGIGAIITRNASVSGAEAGCQAECGAAAAMAAAAAVHVAGGTPQQIGSAVSITLMNCMGLVCDPVAGLVQLPCSFRNASQAVNALLSADMALAGQNSVIPPDEAIEAMARVGRSLPQTLRETAQGGIATTPTGKRIKKSLRLDELG